MMSISRSTASLDTFRTESKVDKLSRLSKSYSLTNLSKRKRSSSSEKLEKTFDKDTLSSRNKLKVNRKKSSESPRDRNLIRLSKNIERDRNSGQVFSKAYRERCEGVMSQTTSRTESKKRDSAALSAGRMKLPPISKPTIKQTAPRSGKPEVINSAPRVRSGRNVNEEPTRRARTGREEDARKKSVRPEENSRGGRGGKNFPGAVSRANPGRGLAGTVNKAVAATRGGTNKPADDVKLNKKYAGVVCETCKLQIHEKLKRGYTKYRSLEKMKACEKCLKSVIDFDFYQICIDCAKELQVCAKCASGSTMISGERFVEVVRHGVTENILSMNDRELSQFAKKHAKIGIVEQKISTIENQPSDKSAATTRTPSARSSAKSRRALSAKSNKSSKQSPKPIEAELKVEEHPKVSTSKSKKVSKNSRSITSSSSPLVGGESENETCLSSTESDEAYGSGHISSVSDVKTARSATNSTRSRHKSSEILRQIRSLTTLQVTSPSSAQSVIREIRSLTEMDYYDDDEKSVEGGRQTPDAIKTPSKPESTNMGGTPVPSPRPSYTPFSGTSDKTNLQEDQELREYMNSRTPTIPPITITGTVTQESHSRPQLEPSQVSVDPQLEVREYSPSPPVVTITTVTKECTEEESSADSSGESEIEDDGDINCDEVQLDNSTQNKDNEVVIEDITNVDTEVKAGDNTIDDESETVTDETESIAEVIEHISPEGDMAETGITEPGNEVTASELAELEVTSMNGSNEGSKSAETHDNNSEEGVSSEVMEELVSREPTDQDTTEGAMVTETISTRNDELIQCEGKEAEMVLETHIPAFETSTNYTDDVDDDVDDVEELKTDGEMSDEESQQIPGKSKGEGVAKNDDFARMEEGEDLNSDADRNHDLIIIEDVLEEEVLEEEVLEEEVCQEEMTYEEETTKSISVPREEIQEMIESVSDYITPYDEVEVTEIVEIENRGIDDSKINAARIQEVDDVRVEDVDDDHFKSLDEDIRITELKQLPTEESADDSSDTTDEARQSSELETFLGDTPKSIDSNDSPRHQQTGSQDPSSTEVQVSSSASGGDSQTDGNCGDSTPRSRKPIFERQFSENAEDKESESVLEAVGENFDYFSQSHIFDFIEIHKNSPEEILYDEEDQEEYYEQCYQYQYNTRLRIRLEDIPEEGTLSKESTYLSYPFTDTMEKEDTAMEREESILEVGESMLESEDSVLEKENSIVEKEDSTVEKEDSTVEKEDADLYDLDREVSVEAVVNDIVNCALIRASLSLMDEKTPKNVGRSS